MTRRGTIFAATALLALVVAKPARAQFPPDSFTNLKVYSKTIPQRELLANMRQFSFALGVSCTHCHVGDSTTPLSQVKFASDEKQTKEKARMMLQMVASINERLKTLPSPGTPPVTVSCQTCHRGLSRPVLIDDELNSALAFGGAKAAEQRYRALRTEYADRGAYDFSESTLNTFAFGLGRGRRYADGITLLRLSSELHPSSPTPHFYAAELLRASGDTASAIRSLREALRLDPGLAPAKQALERLLPKAPTTTPSQKP